LHQLREETKQAYNEAQMLKARWKELEREQNELYSVRHLSHDQEAEISYRESSALRTFLPPPQTKTRYNKARRSFRSSCNRVCQIRPWDQQ
jgi:hypothetical protein